MTSSRRRDAPTLGFVAMCASMLWLCTAIAAAAFWPVYESPRYIVMAAVTTFVGSLIAIIGARLRLGASFVVLMVITAFVSLGVPLAVPDETVYGVLPTVEGLRLLLVASAVGWKQLLTITLPVGAFQALLVPAFILTLVSTTWAMSMALRSGRSYLAPIGPVVLFAAGIAFGPTTTFVPLALGLGLFTASLAWVLMIRRQRALTRVRGGSLPGSAVAAPSRIETNRSGARSLVSVVAVVAVALGGAVGATTLLPPSAERTVLRSTITQPFVARAYPSPLSGFRRYLQPQNAESTMMTVTGLAPGTRIRVATLDTYDGIVFSVGGQTGASSSGSFTLVPLEFDQSQLEGSRVSVSVSVGAYGGVWLPTVGKLERVAFDGPDAALLRGSFYYNDNTGSAAVVHPLETGDTYELSAVLPAVPSDVDLSRVTVGDSSSPTISATPQEISVALDRYTEGVDGQGAQLVAAIDGLREEGYISHGIDENEPASRSGHSSDRITELFSASQMIGDDEQYAVAAALLAHELGFPARVVLGFAPEVSEGSGQIEVTGSDVAAWIEVDTAQYGWVTIDSTPPPREIPEAEPDRPTQVARPQAPIQPPPDESKVNEDQPQPETGQDEPAAEDELLALILGIARIAGVALLGIAVLLSPFLTVIGIKFGRRVRRRRAASSVDRISGGWREFEDVATDRGYSVPRASTRAEFAAVVGGRQPLILAATADRAVFSLEGPDPDEADIVWEVVDDLTTELNRGLSTWQRIRARVSLRSLDLKSAWPSRAAESSGR